MRDVRRGPWALCRVAMLVIVAVTACARAPLPRRLGGLTRTRVWSGERAARLMEELHGREVAPASSAVAEYGRTGQLRLYRSRFADVATAHGTFMLMLGRLETGDSPFSPPREISEYPGHWFTVGPGGHNALWESDESVYWLAGDPELVQRAVEELPAPSAGRWT